MYILSDAVKKLILPALIIGVFSSSVNAQEQDSTSNSAADSAAIAAKATDKRQKVTGKVMDSSTGKPLSGISISVPNYSGTFTNASGEFTVSVPDYETVLLITGADVQNKEVPLRGRKRVEVSLLEKSYLSVYDVAKLPSETKSKSRITGAVESINVDDSWERVNESADSYLQGRVRGLNAVRRSGTPGIGANMFLRGYSSLYANNQPLLLVDGLIYDYNDYGNSIINGHRTNSLSNIDIKDIDNITVIKDATASTYGTRAANGVVLITTNRAKQQATSIDFGAYSGFNAHARKLPVMDASGYRSFIGDALIEQLTRLNFSPLETQNFLSSVDFFNDNSDVNVNPTYYTFHPNKSTDWQKEVLGNSYNQNYYLKVTGGDNIATYGLSLGYLNSKGSIKETGLSRYQTRFNADLNLTRKLKGVVNLSYILNQQDLKDQGYAPTTNPLYLSLIKSPFLRVHKVSPLNVESPNFSDAVFLGDSDFDPFSFSNPAAIISNMQSTNNNYRFQGSVGFSYAIKKSLNFNYLGGLTYDKVRENIFIPEKGVVPDTLNLAIAKRTSGSNVKRLNSFFNDLRLSYSKDFNLKHKFTANGGFRFDYSKAESDFGYTYNSATDEFVTVGNGTDPKLRIVGGDIGDWNWLNIYGNAEYEYKNKYLASLNFGIDGSSRFGKDANTAFKINGNRMALMPSIALGWIVSNENFFSEQNSIEFLKLRGSYGLVGNDFIGNYSARQTYTGQNFLGLQGLILNGVANSTLKYETVNKLDLGVDASLLNERISVTIDFYNNKTHDMLTYSATPTITGLPDALVNGGEMVTNGIELGVNGRVLNKKVKWDLGVSVSSYRSEVTKLGASRVYNQIGDATVITAVGYSPNLFYGYKALGVFSSTEEAAAASLKSRDDKGIVTPFKAGDMEFADLNSDGFIDSEDRDIIGNANPDLFGFINSTLSWKKLSLDALFNFTLGNDVYNQTRRTLESMSGFENQLPSVVNRWRSEGQVTNMPKASLGDPVGNSRFSDRWIENGSYLRLRTISLSYNFPIKDRALKYAKVYLTGNNVFTLTKYLGFDPEFSSSTSVFSQGIDYGYEPQFKTIQLGVRIGL